MQHTGEIIALMVAISWTATAIFAEVAVRRLGTLRANIVRLSIAIVLLTGTLMVMTGSVVPPYADAETWCWMLLSGLVGFTFGDYCLFNSYQLIGSRFGQLLMTLAPVFAAVTARIALGETLSGMAIVAMTVTLSGIAISIVTKGGDNHHHLKLPLRGVIYGIGAAAGQGVGIVISKTGLVAYAAAVPEGATAAVEAMPLAATLIRSYAGLVGFVVMLKLAPEGISSLRGALEDRTGLTYMTLGAIFGPFVGVTLSLMAVQHADAGVASTIMALTPILILLPARVIYKQKVTTAETVGAIISVVGTAMFFIC